MGISDLFVSYNQVQAPSYLESPQVEYTPIGEELTNQENLNRIQSRNQKKRDLQDGILWSRTPKRFLMIELLQVVRQLISL